MDKHAIIKLKKEGHSNRQVAKMLHINRKTVAKYWNEYQGQLELLDGEMANIKAVQEEICSEPTYDTSKRKSRKYTEEMDMYLDEILADVRKNGDKAVVKITQWPEAGKNPVGKVIDILGSEGENNAEMNAILAEYNLPYTYPQNVVDAAEKLSGEITPEEIARREDFREVTTLQSTRATQKISTMPFRSVPQRTETGKLVFTLPTFPIMSRRETS